MSQICKIIFWILMTQAKHPEGKNSQFIDGRLNDAGFRNQLDSLYKNILRKKVLYEVSVRNISKFDGQNPIIVGLLIETESGKLTDDTVKNFLNSAPDPIDSRIQKDLHQPKKINKDLKLKMQIYHHKFFQISVHQIFQTYQTCQMTVVTVEMMVVRHLFCLIATTHQHL